MKRSWNWFFQKWIKRALISETALNNGALGVIKEATTFADECVKMQDNPIKK